jgi:hypothetical protein
MKEFWQIKTFIGLNEKRLSARYQTFTSARRALERLLVKDQQSDLFRIQKITLEAKEER